MESWLLLPVILGGITLILWLLSSPFYWTTRKVKHLIPLPIFGNSLRVLFLGKDGYLQYLNNKFPREKFFGYHMFTRPALFIRDLDLINKIFVSSFDHFTSRGFHINQKRDPSGSNLSLIHGQQWKEIRGKLTPFFTPAKLKVMLKCAETSITKMKAKIDENLLSNQPIIDMSDVLMMTTVDVISQSIFGIQSDSFEKNSEFIAFSKEVSHARINAGAFLNLISPKIYNFFNLTLFGKVYETYMKRIVNDIMKYRKKENIHRTDVFQGLMELLKPEEDTEEKYFPDNTVVPKYNMDTVISQSMILYAGAFETTTISMSYCLHELALHPDIQEACREEVRSVIQENNCTEITLELAQKLPYLTAVIKESLRLHPLFLFYGRECTKDYRVPGSDFIIEKGTLVNVSQKHLHMDEKYFPEPNQFRPERFLSEGDGGSKTGLYIPFGLGPRMCIGANFARVVMNLMISSLLLKYKFTVCHKTEIPLKDAFYSFLPKPANGVWLNVLEAVASG